MGLRFPAKKVVGSGPGVSRPLFRCSGDGGRLVRQDIGAESQTSSGRRAVAFDVSAPLREMATSGRVNKPVAPELKEIRKERVLRAVRDRGHSPDGALQGPAGSTLAPSLAIPSPSLTFEGVSNLDNFNIFGFRVNPPDPVGDVGPNHYVEMINLVYAVYDKTGNLLVGPVDTGTLWADFPIEDCTDPSGDPIVIHDQLEDRWLLSQFTTRGLADPDAALLQLCRHLGDRRPDRRVLPLRVHHAGDPDGGFFFPDYPKYGIWKKTLCPHDPRLRLDRRVRDQRLRPREKQDDRRQPECPRGSVLPGFRRPCRSI